MNKKTFFLIFSFLLMVGIFLLGTINVEAAPLRYSKQNITFFTNISASEIITILAPTEGDLTSYLLDDPAEGPPWVCTGYGYVEGGCNSKFGPSDNIVSFYPTVTDNSTGNHVAVTRVSGSHYTFDIPTSFPTATIHIEGLPDGEGQTSKVKVSMTPTAYNFYIPPKAFNIGFRLIKYQWTTNGQGGWMSYGANIFNFTSPSYFTLEIRNKVKITPSFFCVENNVGTVTTYITYNGESLISTGLFTATFPESLISGYTKWTGLENGFWVSKLTFSIKPNTTGEDSGQVSKLETPYPSINTSFSLTVKPAGEACGYMPIVGEDVISINKGDTIENLYSTPVNYTNVHWYSALWVGTAIPGVDILSPLAHQVPIIPIPDGCPGGPPIEALNDSGKGFFSKFFNRFDILFNKVFADVTCVENVYPQGNNQILKINTSGVGNIHEPLIGEIRLQAFNHETRSDIGVKIIDISILPQPSSINLFADPNELTVMQNGSSEDSTIIANLINIDPGVDYTVEPSNPNLSTELLGTEDTIRTLRVGAGTAPVGNHSVDVTAKGNISTTEDEDTITISISILANLPDLTAGSITPTSAIVDVPTTFYSTITNISPVSTGTSFPYFFQWTDEDPSKFSSRIFNIPIAQAEGEINDLPSSTTATLGGNLSRSVPTTHTFPQSGTYWMRACADKTSSAGGGVIVESNESNNCGGSWTEIVVSNLPDLTAGSITPTTAITNISTTFYSTITNISPVSTGTSFPVLFHWTDEDPYAPISSNFIPKALAANEGESSVITATLDGNSDRIVDIDFTFTSAGTYWMSACADKSSSAGGGVITESNEENNCSSWTEIVVSNLPDLTAGIVDPDVAAVGVPTTFYSTITNISPVSTGTSFPYFFQTQIEGEINDLPSSTTATLGGNLSRSVPTTHTFPQSGTYWMRACADKTSSAGGGVITESNEENNCSSWTPITVVATSTTATITVDPSVIVLRSSSNLEWSSTEATSCTGTNFNTNGATSGKILVSPSVTTEYSVICYSASQQARDSTTLTVTTSGSNRVPIFREN